MGPQVTVGPLQRRHLKSVSVIDAQVYPVPWSRSLWLAELERPGRVYLAATDGRELIGYAGAMVAAEDLHVMTVVTRPDRQAQGIGTRLMLELVERGLAAGCTAMTLEVRAGNEAAQALYRRFGMVPIGVRKAYYAPDGEDALVMWVRDIHEASYRERMHRLQTQAVA